MRILLCFALLLPVAVIAQTKGDYQNAMATFRHFYNTGQGDSIHAMFNQPYPSTGVDPLWNNEQIAKDLKEFGTLRYFEYLGVDETDHDTVRVFQTFFSKAGEKTTSLTLHKNNKLGTFRFMTTSDGIDALLKRRKASR